MHLVRRLLGALGLVTSLVSVWAGAADIQFVPETIGSIGKGYGLAIGDVDGDGRPDVLLADVADFSWFRNGDWQRFVLASKVDGQGAMSIDAADIDGDGKCEIAICTRGPLSAVYFLRRPADPTQPWQPVRLPSEPQQHRIRWARPHSGRPQLIAVPDIGRKHDPLAREATDGSLVKVYAYEYSLEPSRATRMLLVESMRDMHSFAVAPDRPGGPERLIFAGIEGVELMGDSTEGPWRPGGVALFTGMESPVRRADRSYHSGIGEIDAGRIGATRFLATVEPKHGNRVVVYPADGDGRFGTTRKVIDDTLSNGHALDCVDLLGLGRDQIVVGWWGDAARKNYGIRLYVPRDSAGSEWDVRAIDEGVMACQSMRIADMDRDGRLDIVAAGWSSKNLVVYRNRSVGSRGEPARK